MPSTRSNPGTIADHDLPDDYSDDPDYREDSASDDDDIPRTMGRDRAEWVITNVDAVEELYRAFKDTGRQLFGEAFFQCGDVTRFGHFVYKYTSPGAV